MLYKISSGSRPKLDAFLARLPTETVISSEEIEALIRERIMPAFRYCGSAPLVGARVTFHYVPDGSSTHDSRTQGLIATFRVNKGTAMKVASQLARTTGFRTNLELSASPYAYR